MPGRWGSAGFPAAVSITFDNLGEAVELERGLWPQAVPLGQHFSVTHALPTLLKLLAEMEFSATFFIEGLNAQWYPAALKSIVSSGHEIGYHAWRHEEWQKLAPAEEVQILERGLHALATLAIRPHGFRPPGGALTSSSVRLLKERGFTYCSPAGSVAKIADDLVFLPFQWQYVDAYAYLPRFASMRESLSAAREPLSPDAFRASLFSALHKVIQQRGYLSLLFHPFIEDQPEYFAVMSAVLQELRALASQGLIWCVPCDQVASWMYTHLQDFAAPSFEATAE
jgi:peptidoglycan/xylan/chitin deacetylase (PgdA/CDA1 family)